MSKEGVIVTHSIKRWLIVGVALAMATGFLVTTGAQAQEYPEYLELPGADSIQWPGECTMWHEVYPYWCRPWCLCWYWWAYILIE